MNVYDVDIEYQGSDHWCVVAKSIAEAERLFMAKCPTAKIIAIKLYCEDVIVENQ